jgi:hypothetical protein
VMLRMNYALSAILFAGSYVATATQGWAQSYSGRFTLPVEAHFGKTVLEPGEYTILPVAGGNAIRITGEKRSATILAASIDPRREMTHSRIMLQNVNGAYVFIRYESGTMGKSFDFRIDKSVRRALESAAAPQPGTIEIALK